MALARTASIAILFALLGFGPTGAIAHQMEVAMTTVSFRADGQSIEVIHRFYTHDTEQVMSELAGKQLDLVGDVAVQQQFGRYVSDNFKLADQAAHPLPLTLVGVQLEGDFVWVYQESAMPTQLRELTVLNTVLLEVLSNQVNTVNIECGGAVSTLMFSGKTRTQTASIEIGDKGSCLIN